MFENSISEASGGQFSEQLGYTRLVKKLIDESRSEKYFYSLAMGCQMNAHDSEKITAMLIKMGYKETADENKADFIIYNTCCVRENAEEKVFGKLGALKHMKKLRPQVIIALCGCMMQEDAVISTLKKSYRHVDIIFGTFNLQKLPQLLYTRLTTGKQVIDIWKEHGPIVEDTGYKREFSFKASVNIMYGCDNFCTYCIVPYVRGRERSREKDDILNEVRMLANDGVKEITFLGQNVNSYGKNLKTPVTFAQLLKEADKIDGIERIRFMTSHPKDLSDELIDAMKSCKKVCNYLHLPFQSGSSRILEKMNRRYTKEKYLGLIEKIKREIPGIMISTDIIVGFPSETEEDFKDTLDVVEKCGFSNAFTFIYSPRTGTPAASMPQQIDEKTAHERFDRLLDVLNKTVEKAHQAQVGKTVDILVEKESQHDGIITGRSTDNTLVHFKGDINLIGQTVPVKITENKVYYLFGERI